MFGDPREQAEIILLAKLAALTTANGLPETFRLVTREMVHLADVSAAQLPCAFLQMEEPETVPRLSHVYEITLPGRIVVGFLPSAVIPASVANAYRHTLEKMLINDVRLGGLVDQVSLRGTLMPGLWPDVNLLGIGVLFSILYECDPRASAIA